MFLALLYYKMNIYWPLCWPLEIQRQVRNAYGRTTVLGLAICRVPGHGDMHSLCICLILTSGTFRVTGCLSSISYASWGTGDSRFWFSCHSGENSEILSSLPCFYMAQHIFSLMLPLAQNTSTLPLLSRSKKGSGA